MADKAIAGAARGAFASRAWLNDAATHKHPLNELLFDCFKTILLDDLGEQPSPLFNASTAADQSLNCFYYSQPEELCARAFEAFVQDAAIKNGFLVKGTKATKEAELELYPQGEQRARINAAFGRYFCTLGAALQRRS